MSKLLVSTATITLPMSSQPSAIHSRAIDLAHRLENNSKLVAELKEVADKREDTQVGPARLFQYLTDPSSNAGLTADEILALPEPGSERAIIGPDGKTVIGHRDVFDKYKMTRTSQATGKQITEDASFFGDLSDTLPPGAEVMDRINAIKAALADREGAGDLLEAVGLGDDAGSKPKLQGHLTAANSRRSYLRSQLVDAVKLGKQFAAVNNLDDVAANLWINADGSLANKKTPVFITDESGRPDARLNAKPVSIDTFLSYRVDHALANVGKFNGSQYLSLVNSVKRTPKGAAGGTQGAKVSRIDGPTKAQEYMAEIAAYYDQETESGKLHTAELLRVMGEKGTGDDYVLTVGNMCSVFDRVWTIIGTRYVAIQEARAAVEAKPEAKAS